MCFINLEKAYDRVDREALWQVLSMYDMGGKPSKGIKVVNVNSLPYVRVKGCENKSFEIVV